jgi:hypothetical protein
MEIIMNDKIQIEGTVIADCGEYFHMRIAPNVTAYDLKKTWVTKIVERAETDAEQIAKLKSRVEELEGLVVDLTGVPRGFSGQIMDVPFKRPL